MAGVNVAPVSAYAKVRPFQTVDAVRFFAVLLYHGTSYTVCKTLLAQKFNQFPRAYNFFIRITVTNVSEQTWSILRTVHSLTNSICSALRRGLGSEMVLRQHCCLYFCRWDGKIMGGKLRSNDL